MKVLICSCWGYRLSRGFSWSRCSLWCLSVFSCLSLGLIALGLVTGLRRGDPDGRVYYRLYCEWRQNDNYYLY